MRNKSFVIIFLLSAVFLSLAAQNLRKEYIYDWQEFYPYKALEKGMHHTVFQ